MYKSRRATPSEVAYFTLFFTCMLSICRTHTDDRAMASLIDCALCLEPFTDPKLLPCSHTYCIKCLEDLIGDRRRGTVPCPECRADIQVRTCRYLYRHRQYRHIGTFSQYRHIGYRQTFFVPILPIFEYRHFKDAATIDTNTRSCPPGLKNMYFRVQNRPKKDHFRVQNRLKIALNSCAWLRQLHWVIGRTFVCCFNSYWAPRMH